MQVYLIQSADSKTFDHIQGFLSQLGHTITTKEIESNYFTNWDKSEHHILAADAVVAEAGALDDVSMFELYLAHKHNKRTIFLYRKEDTKNALVAQAIELKTKNFEVADYADKDDLAQKMLEFVNAVKDTLDAKLFMIIPPTVNKYLEWIANYTSKSKSDVVRASVEYTAENDADYQKFLADSRK